MLLLPFTFTLYAETIHFSSLHVSWVIFIQIGFHSITNIISNQLPCNNFITTRVVSDLYSNWVPFLYKYPFDFPLKCLFLHYTSRECSQLKLSIYCRCTVQYIEYHRYKSNFVSIHLHSMPFKRRRVTQRCPFCMRFTSVNLH